MSVRRVPPRFSVLLPTRNGGERLDTCIRSVLGQGRDDVELIVADNASDDETGDVLDTHRGDPRLRVVRSATVLPVTDNWNRALEQSSGEYLMLLGDDDLLLPEYFAETDALLRAHDDPDCLTHNGYLYIFPEQSGEGRPSHYREPAFIEPHFERGIVPLDRRRRMVEEMFRGFRFDSGFPGMQRTVVARRAVGLMPRGLFRGPYPDFYAMAGLLVKVPRWSYAPDRLIVLGISPGSFSQLISAGRPDRAVERLELAEAGGRLPGNLVLNTTVAHLRGLKQDFPKELAEMHVNEPLYTLRQVWTWLRQAKAGAISRSELRSRLRALTIADWLRLPAALTKPETLRAARAALRVHLGRRSWVSLEGFTPVSGVTDIGDFAAWLQARPRRNG